MSTYTALQSQMQYLLICKVSGNCLLALHGSIDMWVSIRIVVLYWKKVSNVSMQSIVFYTKLKIQ